MLCILKLVQFYKCFRNLSKVAEILLHKPANDEKNMACMLNAFKELLS